MPLFRLGFRPFFLFAALYSILALVLWGLVWTGGIAITPYGGWFWWHGHEMLYGFTAAVIVGFLLTAVQNWTGQPGLSGLPLAALFALWALARILLLFPAVLPMPLIAAIDISLLVFAAAAIAYYVLRARQWKNILFVPLLLVFAVLNGALHWAAMIDDLLLYKRIAGGVVFVVIFLMSLMGGRVIPFFTAMRTQTQQARPILWLELTALASVLLLALGTLFPPGAAAMTTISLIACLSHLLRISRWRPGITLGIPLLWSLHLASWILVIGFLQLALFHAGLVDDYASLLHSFTIGGIGLIILSMTARVSLGHTGRPIESAAPMTLAFAALVGAALTRVLFPLLLPVDALPAIYLVSILLWIVGFGTFCMVYLPILTRPRIDGRPG
jgi:uncharacterized protein involved in response to NO